MPNKGVPCSKGDTLVIDEKDGGLTVTHKEPASGEAVESEHATK